MTETADYVIIGAGIVGLAVAQELKARFPAARIVVLEKEEKPGEHASGRNSGVLHSGIYYPQGTLKARFCAEGNRRMKRFAAEHGVPCRAPGKVIAAAREEELPALDRLMENAHHSGIAAERLDRAGVLAREPHATAALAGVFCRDTGVVDPRALVAKLAQLLESRGVVFRWGERFAGVDQAARTVATGKNRTAYGFLVNAAGAYADRVARAFGLAQDHALVPFKGLYRELSPARDHLIKESLYPVPDPAFPFLGVHVTRGVAGKVYIGPTAIPAFGRENYGILSGLRLAETVSAGRRLAGLYFGDGAFRRLVHREIKTCLKPHFLAAVRRLLPEVGPEDLLPSAKVGIRPQLVNLKTRRLELDFHIERTDKSLHILNAISPAFTCAFPFAQHIADMAAGREARVAVG